MKRGIIAGAGLLCAGLALWLALGAAADDAKSAGGDPDTAFAGYDYANVRWGMTLAEAQAALRESGRTDIQESQGDYSKYYAGADYLVSARFVFTPESGDLAAFPLNEDYLFREGAGGVPSLCCIAFDTPFIGAAGIYAMLGEKYGELVPGAANIKRNELLDRTGPQSHRTFGIQTGRVAGIVHYEEPPEGEPRIDVALIPASENMQAPGKAPRDAGALDRRGLSENINQAIARGSDWRRFVTDSRFQLGEKTSLPANYVSVRYEIQPGAYPLLDGSTVAIPLAHEFARQHLGFTDEEAYYFVNFTTTHPAYDRLITQEAIGEHPVHLPVDGGWERSDYVRYINHPVDIILVTEPSADELELAKKNDVTLIQKPICSDAFVFITHKSNPVNSLTLQQIRDIYSGRVTNWKELGGANAPISAYQRPENSGSQTAMIHMVMKGAPMLPPETVRVIEGMGGLVDAVAEYQNKSASIGYTYKYYVDTLYKNENIKILRIDGVYPEEKNIRSGAYPLATRYYGVVRGSATDGSVPHGEPDAERSTGAQFLEWILSPEGQRCVRQAGYIPYLDI